MNPRPLLLALALAVPAAHADESANASAAARASAATAAKPAANAVEARKELVELRSQIGVLSRRMAELSMQLGDAGPQAYAFRYLGDADRGMIGVVLSSDDAGARIDALTPDGPASRAGLQSGDVLVSIDGKELPRTDSRAAHAEARRLLADLDVGENVRLGYRRKAAMFAKSRLPRSVEPRSTGSISLSIRRRPMRASSAMCTSSSATSRARIVRSATNTPAKP